MGNIKWENPKITVEQVPDNKGSVPIYNKSDFVIEDGVLVEYIGKGGNILLPPKVLKIGENAFGGCMTLTSVVFSPTVKEIGDYAFYGCRNLVKIKLPSELKSIGECAFYLCSSLTDVELPVSVKEMGIESFYGTPWGDEISKNFIIDDGILKKYIGNSSNVIIPFHVRKIDDKAFFGSKIIEKVSITSNVTTIGVKAFSDCANLKTVIMTSNMKEIEGYAFSNCPNLRDIKIPPTTHRGGGIFNGTPAW